MKIEFKLILILIFFGVISCSSNNNGGIFGEVCYQCETDNDCNSDEVCSERWPVDEQVSQTSCTSFTYCAENYCKTKNIDCGYGDCTFNPAVMIPMCHCNEGTKLYKHIEYRASTYDTYYVRINICLEYASCETNDDCLGVFGLNDDNELNDLPVCNEGKCIAREEL